LSHRGVLGPSFLIANVRGYGAFIRTLSFRFSRNLAKDAFLACGSSVTVWTFLAMGLVRTPGDAEEEGRAVVVGAVVTAVVCAVEGTEEDGVLVAWGIIIGAKNG
jgi:hypothetical protein